MPSLLDPSLAPEGHHVIHAYTAGNEPYHLWEPFEGDRDASTEAAYQALKVRAMRLHRHMHVHMHTPCAEAAYLVLQGGAALYLLWLYLPWQY